MNTYNILITEVLVKAVQVQARSKEEAIAVGEQMYKNEEIVLDSDDLEDTLFEVCDDLFEVHDA